AEVELHVLGERAVTRGEDEAVASEPMLIRRVATHDLLEEQVGGGGKTHRGAGVAVAHLLHRVGREDSRGVDGLVVNGIPLESCHDVDDPSASGAAREAGARRNENPPRTSSALPTWPHPDRHGG